MNVERGKCREGKGRRGRRTELRLQHYPSTFRREESLKTEVFWSAKRVTAFSLYSYFSLCFLPGYGPIQAQAQAQAQAPNGLNFAIYIFFLLRFTLFFLLRFTLLLFNLLCLNLLSAKLNHSTVAAGLR